MANPFLLEIEESLPMFSIVNAKGEVFEVAGLSPTTMIRRDQAWGVKLTWTTQGQLNYLLNGTWKMTVYLQKKIGGGYERSKPKAFTSAPSNYSDTIDWSAGEVGDGQYEVSVLIQLYGPSNVPGPVVLSGEGPLLTFYTTPIPPGP